MVKGFFGNLKKKIGDAEEMLGGVGRKISCIVYLQGGLR